MLEQELQGFEIHHKMKAGKLDDLVAGGYGIVLGRELSYKLGVDVGDQVIVYAPEIRATPVGAVPRLKRFTVVDFIFEIGMEKYDAGLAIVALADAQRLYQTDGPDGLRLKESWTICSRPSASRAACRRTGANFYRVRDWMRGRADFFKAIAMEKRVMFMILSLIVAVAAFNLVSTLVMLVQDSRPTSPSCAPSAPARAASWACSWCRAWWSA